MKKLLTLLLALTLCVTPLLSGLCEEPAAEATLDVEITAETAETPAVEEGNPDDVLLTINGTPITRAVLDGYFDNISSYYSYYGYDVSDESVQSFLKAAALNSALSYTLMDQKAVELNVTMTDAEVEEIRAQAQTEWDETVQSFMDYYTPLADDATEEDKAAARDDAIAMINSMGYSLESIVDEYVTDAKYDRVQSAAVGEIVVTDEEVKAAYDAQVAEDEAAYANDVASYEYASYYGTESLYTPEGYRGVIQILLDVDSDLMDRYTSLAASYEEQQAAETTDAAAETTEAEATAEPVTAEQVQAAKDAILDSVAAKVEAINTRLASGETFQSLIPEYNIDPGMEQEENLTDGYKVHKNSIIYDPSFVEAAFSVDEVGDVSAPYVGSYGVYIVMYLRDVPAGAVPMTEEELATRKAQLQSDRETSAFNDIMTQWITEAAVETTDETADAWTMLKSLLALS